MSRIVTVVLLACVTAPLAAQAQGKRPISDSDYCAALSERYIRYVGRSEAGPHSRSGPTSTVASLSHSARRATSRPPFPFLSASSRMPGWSCRRAADA
jgi:hypothetical protein